MVSHRKRTRRARERGAAVFVVVLVIAMLTAIGVFAVSSASLSTSSAGHERLATQAQYLTELGVQVVLAELERMGGWNAIEAGQLRATALGQAVNCSVDAPSCWVFDRTALEAVTGGELLVNEPGSPVGTPGSLGYADLDWNLRVELSDKRQALVAGNSIVPDQKVTTTFCNISVNARGAIWPRAAANQDLVVAGSGGQSFVSGDAQVLCSAN